MILVRTELSRLWRVVLARGVAFIMLGALALAWPEALLVPAMLIVGIVGALLGGYELLLGISLHRRSRVSPFITAHGVAALAFGLVTVGSPALSIRLALTVIATWFALYAGLAFAAAATVASRRSVRSALVAYGGLNLVFGGLIALYPLGSMLFLLAAGAGFAALFGAWQLSIAVWIRRALHARAHQSLAPIERGAQFFGD